jgi:DNA-directed RNA polymerase specialized sigma24 family protein
LSAIIDHAQPAGSGTCRNGLAAADGVTKTFRATSNGVALDSQTTHEAVIIMGPWTSEPLEARGTSTVDQSLTRPPDHDIAVDQLMRAVEGVRAYVKIHLGRFGFRDDVDDVLQDIRLAAWQGTVRGTYRAVPGVTFDAWVQGIACNLCAYHVRRGIARSALPLDEQFGSGTNGLTDLHMMRLDEQSTNHVWATEVLQFVKTHVPERTWDLALTSVSEQKAESLTAGTMGASVRTRWHAIFVVRQMALTVSRALDIEPERVADLVALRTAAVAALPNPLLQLIAEEIVLPAVLGKARGSAIAGVAEKAGVSVRYVKVHIGLVRNLVLAAEEILRAGTGIEGSVIETPVTPIIHAVAKA